LLILTCLFKPLSKVENLISEIFKLLFNIFLLKVLYSLSVATGDQVLLTVFHFAIREPDEVKSPPAYISFPETAIAKT